MKPIRILLSEVTSRHLTNQGAECFIVVSRAMRTEEPATRGRWEIHLLPTSIAQADAAVRVALGRSTARRNLTRAQGK